LSSSSSPSSWLLLLLTNNKIALIQTELQRNSICWQNKKWHTIFSSMSITSSENWETLVFGDNMTSTLATPPLACNVIGCSLGSRRTTPGSCNAGVTGFKVTLKVNGAPLLFTIGTIFFSVWPIRSAPNCTIFCLTSATPTCRQTSTAVILWRKSHSIHVA